MVKHIFDNDWQNILAGELQAPYYLQLRKFLAQEYATQTIYPPMENVMTALQTTAFNDVKVVILGQDPYHGANQAHGLSFSVQDGVALPPSLRNMLKELRDDLGCELPQNGNLTKWAEQGVLLLNTVLTVRQAQAHSHKDKGWEQFTDAIIEKLAQREKPIVFILWGRPAQQKIPVIRKHPQHALLHAPHPSPLSAYRGFFGSKPFSKTNQQLIAWGETPIEWCLP